MILPSRRWSPRLCAFAAVTLFLALVARFWHPVYGLTELIQLDASNDDLKIAAFRAHPVYVHRDTGGYDGLYYAQIAYDPLLTSPELPRAVDNLPYRARRILVPALAWLLAAGRAGAIVHVYALLNPAAWLLLAALLWRLLAVADLRGWLAWAGVLFSAGALGSVRLALTDLPMLALLTAALGAAERARTRPAVAWLAAAALARETALLGAAGLLTRPWGSRRNFLVCAGVAAPLALWLAYLRWRVAPDAAGWGNFTLPLAGWVEKGETVILDLGFDPASPFAWTTLLATLGLTVQAGFILTRWRRFNEAWWRVGAAYAGLMLLLGPAVWEGHPGAATRALLPLTLAFNVLAHRTRAILAWLVLGNLGVFAGFLLIGDAHSHPREIFAGHSGGLASVVRLDTGWYNTERTGRHVWAWSPGRARLDFETWTGAPVTVRFAFALRSLAPRIVVVRQDGRELWRGPVGEHLAEVAIPLRLGAGHVRLELTTDAPASPEAPGAGSRQLAFALYDPHLEAAQPQ